jgi:elongator complex protein 2
LTDHTGSINCIASLSGLLATGSSDGSVNVYRFSSESYTLTQSIKIGSVYPLTLCFHDTVDGILLAVGGTSRHIHLYASQSNSEFVSMAILKGHEDWIRGLDFTLSNSDIYLASASQDRYIRLWKITKSPETDAFSPQKAF